MAKLVRGPYTLKWGENTIEGVTEISLNYDVATNDYETVQGQTFTVDGAITASVELTLLYSDVDSLRLLFPQYYKAKGETMSTGEKVTADEGAIDIEAAKCGDTDILYPLDILSCNEEVFRLTNAKTSLSGMNIDGSAARTVTVTFRGMPAEEGAIAPVQLFPEDGIEPQS
jgi:hypothetical protein